ncbi:MAG TPA: hypothetical protein VGM05_02165 [Planctomycetaceae bacterium]
MGDSTSFPPIRVISKTRGFPFIVRFGQSSNHRGVTRNNPFAQRMGAGADRYFRAALRRVRRHHDSAPYGAQQRFADAANVGHVAGSASIGVIVARPSRLDGGSSTLQSGLTGELRRSMLDCGKSG